MISLRDFYAKNLPYWMVDGEGGAVVASVCLLIDAAIDRLYQGLLARFPTYAPADALGPIGRDRKIVRGINEPQSSYAVRLCRWLTDHQVRGNPFALHDQLRGYLQADCMIRTVDRRGNWFTTAEDGARSVVLDEGNWDWDGVAASPNWARFWVIIYPVGGTDPWSPSVGGAPAAWPVGGTIGTTATPDQVATVRAIVQDWKPAGTRCEWIIIAFDAASFDPLSPEPDGHWTNSGKQDDADSYVVARLASARYWRGTPEPAGYVPLMI